MPRISRRQGKPARLEEPFELTEEWVRRFLEEDQEPSPKVANHTAFEKQLPDLRRRWPESFVCFADGKPVGHDKNRKRLLSRLQARGIELSSVYIGSTSERKWILLKAS